MMMSLTNLTTDFSRRFEHFTEKAKETHQEVLENANSGRYPAAFKGLLALIDNLSKDVTDMFQQFHQKLEGQDESQISGNGVSSSEPKLQDDVSQEYLRQQSIESDETASSLKQSVTENGIVAITRNENTNDEVKTVENEVDTSTNAEVYGKNIMRRMLRDKILTLLQDEDSVSIDSVTKRSKGGERSKQMEKTKPSSFELPSSSHGRKRKPPKALADFVLDNFEDKESTSSESSPSKVSDKKRQLKMRQTKSHQYELFMDICNSDEESYECDESVDKNISNDSSDITFETNSCKNVSKKTYGSLQNVVGCNKIDIATATNNAEKSSKRKVVSVSEEESPLSDESDRMNGQLRDGPSPTPYRDDDFYDSDSSEEMVICTRTNLNSVVNEHDYSHSEKKNLTSPQLRSYIELNSAMSSREDEKEEDDYDEEECHEEEDDDDEFHEELNEDDKKDYRCTSNTEKINGKRKGKEVGESSSFRKKGEIEKMVNDMKKLTVTLTDISVLYMLWNSMRKFTSDLTMVSLEIPVTHALRKEVLALAKLCCLNYKVSSKFVVLSKSKFMRRLTVAHLERVIQSRKKI